MAKRIVKNRDALHNKPVQKPVQPEPPQKVVNHIPNKRIVTKPVEPKPVEPEKVKKPEPLKQTVGKNKRIVTKPIKMEESKPVIEVEDTKVEDYVVKTPEATEDFSYSPKEESKSLPLDEVINTMVDELVKTFITRDEIETLIENTIKKMIMENTSAPKTSETVELVKEVEKPKEPVKIESNSDSVGMVFKPISRKKSSI